MASITGTRQVVLVSCRAQLDMLGKKVHKDNIIALSWHMPVSFNPVMYAIAIGKTRFSRKIIDESGVFVVNFISDKLEEKALFVGRNSGLHMDKWSKAKLTKEEAESVDCCRIKQAIGYLECEVASQVEAGDHIIYFGKVLKQELKKNSKRLFQVEGNKFTTTV
ncbi:MAG: flavin reductase family protein [Nanoarchaeota archaeon]|nr:flavin reductase family protein [Nanoarchaeota archaeon]MBU1704376.1 flavin reductase family protein [Nanoarchaeota archaeon]